MDYICIVTENIKKTYYDKNKKWIYRSAIGCPPF
jgi:hypothetical protein